MRFLWIGTDLNDSGPWIRGGTAHCEAPQGPKQSRRIGTESTRWSNGLRSSHRDCFVAALLAMSQVSAPAHASALRIIILHPVSYQDREAPT